MKKLLFVHDHVFIKSDDSKVYSPGGFPAELWGKYLEHFDQIDVVGRCSLSTENVKNNHVLSSANNVFFKFVERISSPFSLIKNKGIVTKKISELVRNSDYVIARLPSENGLIAVSEARKLNKPICIEVVGCAWDGLWNYGSLLGRLYAPVAYLRMRNAVKLSDFVLYVTNSFLQNRYPSSPSAITVSASNVKVDTKNALWKKREYKNKIIFGLIGNYKTKYKGIDIAIKALAASSWPDKNFELRVLGKGNPSEYQELARSLDIAGNIKFYEPLPSGQPVLNWLDEIDVYIQPSLQEGLPRALIESMSRGCVALGSTTGGIPELLESQFIHKAGDVRSFVKTIESLMQDKHRFDDISKRNIQEAVKYDFEEINRNRSNFFTSFVEAGDESN